MHVGPVLTEMEMNIFLFQPVQIRKICSLTQQKLYFRSKLENYIQAKQVYAFVELLKRLSFQSDFEFLPPEAAATTKDMIEKSLFAFDGPVESSLYFPCKVLYPNHKRARNPTVGSYNLAGI